MEPLEIRLCDFDGEFQWGEWWIERKDISLLLLAEGGYWDQRANCLNVAVQMCSMTCLSWATS